MSTQNIVHSVLRNTQKMPFTLTPAASDHVTFVVQHVLSGTSKSGLCSPMWPVCLSTWKNVFFNAYEAGRQCAVAVRKARPRRLEKLPAYQKENMKSHSCSWAVNHAWLFVSLSLQVYRCSPSSPKGNRRGVLAAIARLKTATCSRPWTNTGMRTVSNVPAATAALGRWAPPSIRKPTSSSVAGTTWGKKDTQSPHSTHNMHERHAIRRAVWHERITKRLLLWFVSVCFLCGFPSR